MNKAILHVLGASLLAGSVLLTGCGEEEVDEAEVNATIEAALQPLAETTRRMEKRLRIVETENVQLRSDLKALELAAAEKTPAALPAGDVAGVSSEELESKLAEALGKQGEVASYFAQVAQQQILAHEEQLRLEKERADEARRAEEREQHNQRDAERTASMAEELGLNAQQATQLLAARTSMREAMGEMFRVAREEGNFDRDQMREVMTELRENHNLALGTFMSEEQIKSYTEQNEHGFMGGTFGGGDRNRGRGR